MKIYLSSRFERREEMRVYRERLIELGHVVTSRWLAMSADSDPTHAAIVDLADVNAADAIICFTEPTKCGYTTGGRHVELGIAISIGLPVILIGPRENVFYHYPSVTQADSFEDAVKMLGV